MYEIEVRPNRQWIKQYEETVARMAVDEITPAPDLVVRIAQICCALPEVHTQEQGYTWALDMSNDWKMGRKEDCFVVAWRYGHGGNAAFMKALEVVLNQFLV